MKREGGDIVFLDSWAVYDKHCPRRSCWLRTVTRTHDIGRPRRIFLGCRNSIDGVCPKRGETDFVVQIEEHALRFGSLSPDWFRNRRTIENVCVVLFAMGVPPRLIASSIKDMVRTFQPPVEWSLAEQYVEVRGRVITMRLPTRPWVKRNIQARQSSNATNE